MSGSNQDQKVVGTATQNSGSASLNASDWEILKQTKGDAGPRTPVVIVGNKKGGQSSNNDKPNKSRDEDRDSNE
ncbi:hypothetical protein FRC03_008930 [Tulasnella sp. 419]|nr:hypothetical protein FRC02_005765 [Tulasnella sp. 418]KAG8958655.1 hypothetical protein FRC03_008930 [Tulasnella sp. 419]